MSAPTRSPDWSTQTVFLATRGATSYDAAYNDFFIILSLYCFPLFIPRCFLRASANAFLRFEAQHVTQPLTHVLGGLVGGNWVGWVGGRC